MSDTFTDAEMGYPCDPGCPPDCDGHSPAQLAAARTKSKRHADRPEGSSASGGEPAPREEAWNDGLSPLPPKRAAAPVAGSEPHPNARMRAIRSGRPLGILPEFADVDVNAMPPHMCRDGHMPIRYWHEAGDDERCPLCILLSVAGSEDAAPPTYGTPERIDAAYADLTRLAGLRLCYSQAFDAHAAAHGCDPFWDSTEGQAAHDAALLAVAARSLGEQPSDPIDALTPEQLEALHDAGEPFDPVFERHIFSAFHFREALRAALAAPGGRAETEDTK